MGVGQCISYSRMPMTQSGEKYCIVISMKLTAWSKFLLEKLIVTQLRNFTPLWNPKIHYHVHESLPVIIFL